MNWSEFRTNLAAEHPDDLRTLAIIDRAIGEMKSALGALAGLGHPHYLVEGVQPTPPARWPRWVFSATAGKTLVRDQEQLSELGPGWFDTMEEAKAFAGREAGFAGRGGVAPSAKVPTTLAPAQTPDERYAARLAINAAAKTAAIARLKGANGGPKRKDQTR